MKLEKQEVKKPAKRGRPKKKSTPKATTNKIVTFGVSKKDPIGFISKA